MKAAANGMQRTRIQHDSYLQRVVRAADAKRWAFS